MLRGDRSTSPTSWKDIVRGVYFTTALALKAKVVVELGTGIGHSTESFLPALRLTDGRLYSVDVYPHGPGGPLMVKQTIQRLRGESRVTFISGDSVEVGKGWDKGDIDVLLCDTHNTGPELEVWGRFNPKVIFVHDTLTANKEIGDTYHVAKAYAQRHGRVFFNLCIPFGLGVIV